MATTEGYEALVVEIDRIVKSSYPTQLKRLRDVLCTKCAKTNISRWILAKPCQIEALTRYVLDGLRHWPYVLDIVTKLACDVKIRDAMLRQEPNLLPDILQQAVKGEEVQSRYTAAAMVILSHPLPDDIGLPSDAQTLFIRLFDHAARDPSLANIKSVHQMLQGTSTLLVGLLSSNVMCRLEDHLINILRSNKGDNQSLSLYCLAIMKGLSTASEDQLAFFDGAYDTQELLKSTGPTVSNKWKPDAMLQFFTDSKAQKTVHLSTLCAMWACTTSTRETLDERSESLLLANEVIDAVPINLREQWRKDNALIARKFGEKALAPVLDVRLRFQALCLLFRLMGVGVFSATAMDSLRDILVDVENLKFTLASIPAANLEHLASVGVFDQSTATTLLQNAVDFAAGANADNLLEASEPILHILRHLPLEDNSTVEGVMLALDVLSCGQKLQSPVGSSTSPRASLDQRLVQDACFSTIQSTRNSLVHELCKVFLKAALSSSSPTYSVPRETVLMLLDLYAQSVPSKTSCSHARQRLPYSYSAMSMVVEEVSPDDPHFDWRSQLQAQVKAQAAARYDNITSIFAKACAELEARCEQVEKPLREERDKYNALHAKFHELSESYADLEAESLDRSLRLDAIEMERNRSASELEAAQEEIESLARRTCDFEKSLQTSETRAREAADEATRQKEAADLGHATSLAKREEENEELQEQLQGSVQEIRTNLEQLHRVRKDQEASASSRDALHKEVERLVQLGNEHQVIITGLQAERAELLDVKKRLDTLVNDRNDELSAERELNQTRMDQVRQQANEESAAEKEANKRNITEIQKQHDEDLQILRQQTSDVQNEMRQLRMQHSSELEQRDAAFAEKKKKIERLGRKCEQKDKHIEEANEMRSNLMAAMGLGGPQSPVALPYRPSGSSAVQTQKQIMDTQSDTSPPTPSSDHSAGTQRLKPPGSFASNNSSGESRSGPTPKRARQGKACKVPSLTQPRLSTRATSWTAGTRVPRRTGSARQPLLSMSANRSPTKTIDPKRLRKSAMKEHFDDLDESTFEGSGLFTGTPGENIMDLGGMLDAESGNSL